MEQNKKRMSKFKKGIVVLLIICLAVFVIACSDISVETLLKYTPKNPLLVASVLLLLYVLKSATIFFPLIILEIAAGHLFEPWTALAVNFIGMLIILTVPYLMGRSAGMQGIQKRLEKYPQAAVFLKKQEENYRFLSFFLRVLSCLPGDVVTLYFGAVRMPYRDNLLFGTLGVLPGMVLATLMGGSIRDPASPVFWGSMILLGTLAASSLIIYYFYQKRLQTKERDSNEQAMV